TDLSLVRRSTSEIRSTVVTTDTGSMRAVGRDEIDPAGMRVIWLLLVAAFVATPHETTLAVAIPELNLALRIPPAQGPGRAAALPRTDDGPRGPRHLPGPGDRPDHVRHRAGQPGLAVAVRHRPADRAHRDGPGREVDDEPG